MVTFRKLQTQGFVSRGIDQEDFKLYITNSGHLSSLALGCLGGMYSGAYSSRECGLVDIISPHLGVITLQCTDKVL